MIGVSALGTSQVGLQLSKLRLELGVTLLGQGFELGFALSILDQAFGSLLLELSGNSATLGFG
ncbi:unnamed protein product, partial [marine sediment metagenome]